ncbi:phosphoenolpyruvate carboxykinase (ATP) [Dendrobium catenatum]|uniref:phosphoenolpyruvate carboxykinase (ATP) n=1 Tax=Dendrobium catenatum TaxID=906689 RepID=A0A2I0W8J6_9ASPA|nr:phosphoenolpyruvate carboxykinase (ATP) [Dendrobium catenatum]
MLRRPLFYSRNPSFWRPPSDLLNTSRRTRSELGEMTTFLLRTLSRSSFATSRSRHPSYACFRLGRTFAVPAAVADEEAETVMFPREGSGVSYGLNWALAGRGVIVKDKAYYNLKMSELEKLGTGKIESMSGLPLYMRGNTTGGTPDISKVQFGKLLKQVASHISSVSSIFVQDGAISSSPTFDAKVRIISDSSSALLPLADILWKTPTRAVSHDSSPLTVYIASSISTDADEANYDRHSTDLKQLGQDVNLVSSKTGENIGFSPKPTTAFAAADIERSSLILCGNAFADVNIIKDALSALAAPIISARGGLPLLARILVSGNSVILLFAPEDTIKSSSDLHGTLLSMDAGVVLSSHGVMPFFQTKDRTVPNVLKRPAAIIFASADSTGALPSISKLSPGQAAYHFLAGYQDGKFTPAYIKGPSSLEPLVLASALHSQLKDSEIPTFLINVNDGGKHINGKELLKLVQSSLSADLPKSQLGADDAKGELKGKYKSFLSGRFEELPEEFSF